MAFPAPSGLSSPDPLTRRVFVQRLIGGTGLSTQALRQGGLIAALAGASTRRLYATTVAPSADIGIDDVAPTSTNNTDTFSVGRAGGATTDAILFFDGTPTLQDFFAANNGATFNLVLTIEANGLEFTSDPILPILIQDNLASVGQTEDSANWNHFTGQTQSDMAGGTSMMTRSVGTQVSFDITNFVGDLGNTIRLTLGGVTPDAGVASFASLQHLTTSSHPYVEAVGGISPSASPTPSSTPIAASASPSPAPASASPTPTATLSPTPTGTVTPTPSPSGTLTPTPTGTLTPTPTPSGTLTPTPTATITPTPTPTPSPSPSASMTVSASSTPFPTPTPAPSHGAVPTPTPTATAGAAPTPSPSPLPALVSILINSLKIDRNHVSFNATANAVVQQVSLAGKKFDNRGEQNFQQLANTTSDLRPFSARDGQVPFIVQASGPDGTYFVRMRAVTSFGYGPPSNEVSFVLGAGQCEAAPPLQPGPLAVVVSGVDAMLTWGEEQGATSYILEVGRSPGASDVLRTNVGSVTTISGRQLPGVYYVRVRGSNACGDGPSSNEVRVVLTTSESSPGQPLFLAAEVTGKNVLLTWSPPVGGGSVDGYRVHAGTTPTGVDAGEQDVAGTSLFAGNVPSGRYYVRVSARNVTGLGPSTAPLIVDVP